MLGMGFVMTPEEAQAIIDKDVRNKDVLYPYLNGEDLNSRPDQSPSRWIVNFHDWPLDRSAEGCWEDGDEKERKKYLQQGRVPADYLDPVAADYPGCLAIVEEKVKPVRAKNKRKVRRERWWHYAERAQQLYATIAGMERVLVRTQVSKHHAYVFVPPRYTYDQRLVCTTLFDMVGFVCVQNSLHEEWGYLHGSTLETRPTYTPSDCFETFTFPES